MSSWENRSHSLPRLGPPVGTAISLYFSYQPSCHRDYFNRSFGLRLQSWQIVLSYMPWRNEKPSCRSFSSAQHEFYQPFCPCPTSPASLLLQGWGWPSSFLRTHSLPAFSEIPSTVTSSPFESFHESPICKMNLPCYRTFPSALPLLLCLSPGSLREVHSHAVPNSSPLQSSTTPNWHVFLLFHWDSSCQLPQILCPIPSPSSEHQPLVNICTGMSCSQGDHLSPFAQENLYLHFCPGIIINSTPLMFNHVLDNKS